MLIDMLGADAPILIIDDEPMMQSIIGELLHAMGFCKVDTSSDGAARHNQDPRSSSQPRHL